ncbi:hypothetical protein [Nocardioides sp.]|uniref:hypothetical protein n=1 Tax=Nocardioides sp. TaxID=35761 RepID=UPI001A1CC10B|nr:hypothetical protein [Nocardioides sp.]MBJ7357229.1 hypothetical protein [Nocardioides sp.]
MAYTAWAATALLVTAGLAAPAGAAPTSPDPGFGGDGSVTLHSDAHPTYLGDLEVLDDGRTMVLAQTGVDPALELWRLRPDGTPDPTFGGGDGVHSFGGPENYEDVHLAVDPDTGRSYVSAFVDGAPFPTFLWRVTESGAPDASFGGGTGQVQILERLVEDLTTAPGGKLVMVGSDFAANVVGVWQLTETGAPDPGFGTGGSVVLSTDPNDQAGAVLRQADGRLVIAGSHYSPTSSNLTVARVTSTGVLDASFGGDGTTVVDPSSPGVTTSTVWSPDLVVRPDGRLVVVAGLNQNSGGFLNSLLVTGLKASGEPDPGFGTRVLTQVAGTDASAALQRDGALVVGGVVPPSSADTGAIVRFTPAGGLDPTWSDDGILPLPGAQGAVLLGLVPTGRLIAALPVENATDDTEVLAFQGTPVPRCKGQLATQFGTTRTDRIVGTVGRDVLVGLGGKDKLKGRDGKDLICGNSGRDKLFGGTGKDKIYGQGGNDLLVGNQGKDVLRGGGGKDNVKP